MSPLRALLVEDSADDAELLLRDLRRAGYDVCSLRVETASDFTAALADRSWDVILSDFSVPGFGGIAALEILKASGLDLPFIIVSGTVGEAVAVEVMKAGAHDYFAKGRLVRLGAAIDREVREAERRRERETEKARAEAEREQLLERLREAVAVRDNFMSIAAHELRTPITALQLQAQGLQRMSARGELPSLSPSTLDAKVKTICGQVARLTTLVNSLLDVTRLTSGHVSLSLESVDLAEVIAEEISALDTVLHQSTSEIHSSGGTVVGHWDRLRIQTAISNLLSNAAKFGEGKPIDVTLASDGEVARVSVHDHGMGVPEEARERIFSKFERAVPREHYGGLGLGLWIAQQFAAAHGGTIRVESVAGEGSTFTLELPLSPLS
jgi:signal transduction histidine kinase